MEQEENVAGADPEFLKSRGEGGRGRGLLYVGHHSVPAKIILGFRWSKKVEITLETKLLANYFYQYFQIFSIFIDKVLSKRKNIDTVVNGKRMRKFGLRFTTSYFLKPFQIIINHFFLFFSSSFIAQFSLFHIRDIKRGNWEREIARSGKINIYLKSNLNLLVINVTQLNFLNY